MLKYVFLIAGLCLGMAPAEDDRTIQNITVRKMNGERCEIQVPENSIVQDLQTALYDKYPDFREAYVILLHGNSVLNNYDTLPPGDLELTAVLQFPMLLSCNWTKHKTQDQDDMTPKGYNRVWYTISFSCGTRIEIDARLYPHEFWMNGHDFYVVHPHASNNPKIEFHLEQHNGYLEFNPRKYKNHSLLKDIMEKNPIEYDEKGYLDDFGYLLTCMVCRDGDSIVLDGLICKALYQNFQNIIKAICAKLGTSAITKEVSQMVAKIPTRPILEVLINIINRSDFLALPISDLKKLIYNELTPVLTELSEKLPDGLQ